MGCLGVLGVEWGALIGQSMVIVNSCHYAAKNQQLCCCRKAVDETETAFYWSVQLLVLLITLITLTAPIEGPNDPDWSFQHPT